MHEIVKSLLEQIERLDKQIQANWRVLAPSIGQEIEPCSKMYTLYQYTEILMNVRALLKQKLKEEFGIIVI